MTENEELWFIVRFNIDAPSCLEVAAGPFGSISDCSLHMKSKIAKEDIGYSWFFYTRKECVERGIMIPGSKSRENPETIRQLRKEIDKGSAIIESLRKRLRQERDQEKEIIAEYRRVRNEALAYNELLRKEIKELKERIVQIDTERENWKHWCKRAEKHNRALHKETIYGY